LKNNIKKILLFVVAVSLLYGVGRLIDITYGSYVFVDRQPYMVMQTKNSMTIKWQTPEEEIGKVAYGRSKENLNNVLMEPAFVDKHSITIPKLQECTKYFYSVSSNSLEISNTNRTFTTLCSNASAQRLWVIGDSGKKGKKQQEVYKSMQDYIANNLDSLNMWVLLGDNAYTSGTQNQYNEAMFKPYKEMIKKFAPWAVIGNHDARRWAFYDIFDFPINAESGGVPSGSESFYSIDNANLHLVMLDSETVDRASDAEMAQWLEKDLQANTKPWVIVAFHTPPYTDGGHHSDSDYDSRGRMKDMRENFVPLFDKYSVDLVLGGHSHDYERSRLIAGHTGKSDTFDKQKHIVQDSDNSYTKPLNAVQNSGTIYQVCGSSSKLDKAELNHPALPFSLQVMGSLIIDITPKTLSSKFLTIDGKIADEFIITKTGDIK